MLSFYMCAWRRWHCNGQWAICGQVDKCGERQNMMEISATWISLTITTSPSQSKLIDFWWICAANKNEFILNCLQTTFAWSLTDSSFAMFDFDRFWASDFGFPVAKVMRHPRKCFCTELWPCHDFGRKSEKLIRVKKNLKICSAQIRLLYGEDPLRVARF